MLYITKRDGRKEPFNKRKIERAMEKAYLQVDGEIDDYADEKIHSIADFIEKKVEDGENLGVEEIQDLVENGLMNSKDKDVARAYIIYRNDRNRARGNFIDNTIEEIAESKSEYWNTENSNKNSVIVTTQRDYFAGAISTDYTMRKLLPKDVVEGHNEGYLHFHDADYFAQKSLANCCLINLEDMLQNGTVVNGVMIEKPHKFLTAATIATQIILGVSSSQYGGCTVSLTHLAPFVRDSFYSHFKDALVYINDYTEEDAKAVVDKMRKENVSVLLNDYYKSEYPETVQKYAMDKTKKEVNAGVQTFNYQVNSMTNTNGQAPFLSVNMYLNETDEYKDELAMIIEEFLNQRILGFKNEDGVYVTPAFPKLLYVLEEDNIHEDSKYWYLTELAAKCTAKRMVPDYISEKIMLRDKVDSEGHGHCYPPMGCVDGQEIVTYKFNGRLFVESFVRMWERFSMIFQVKHQYDDSNPNLYIDLEMVQIYDTVRGSFTECRRIIRNISDKWVDINFSGGRRLLCTVDHPLEVVGKGTIQAGQLQPGDRIIANYSQYSENNFAIDPEYAWTLGVIICDGCYNSMITTSIALNGEDEIEQRYIRNMKTYFNIEVKTDVKMRGAKGNYKDLIAVSQNMGEIPAARSAFEEMFGGIQKIYRHIPNEVFEWCYSAKLAFMAGMIDADGYINNSRRENNSNTHQDSIVQLGSTNKELALQQMALAQALGMKCALYHNHYNASKPDAIRYRVEFVPSSDLVNFISCDKKREKFVYSPVSFKGFVPVDGMVEVRDIIPVYRTDFSYDVTTESEHFEVSGLYSHNCRSFLTPYIDKNGKPKYYGRMNCGVVTISLPDVALSSGGDFDKFWKIFDERTEVCHRALRIRFDRVANTTSDVAPILWQHGAYARLKPGERIGNLIKDGYATVSLGYAGLYECVKYMTGESHSSGKGLEFGLKVMQALNDKCAQWRSEENISYSLYGTPIESTTYKFAKSLNRRFGNIEGITDHNYITNSYHLSVREQISAFDKLRIESQYQKLSPGGAISYIEVPNMQNNIPAVLEIIKFMYENIMYAEINSKSDYCANCGYDGEILIKGEPKHLYWECPKCGCTKQKMLYIARRTCGLT